LTQSTHAHLLSFAVLFSLTGLVFACSSWPVWMRCVLGPWVVIAVTADVALWWLARLCDECGPYFAMGIIATGGLAGLGLAAQITLSLFNMYAKKGKAVIAFLFLLAGGIGGLVTLNKIKPELEAKANPPVEKKPEEKKPDVPPPLLVGDGKKVIKVEAPPYRPIHDFDRLLTLPVLDENGQPLPPAQVQWGGGANGSMVSAFFEKDKAFKKVIDDDATAQEAKDKLRAERQAELEALVAWGRAAEAARAAGYTGNGFDVPPALAGKMNPKFVTDGKLQVRSLIEARCVTCHSPDGKQADYPLDTFEGLSKYLVTFPPPAADGKGALAPQPAPVPPKPADPIPAAKDD
jgi:hypothetical protein